MHHDEMIGKVQALAHLPDRGSAERAAHAVVSTLSERLPSGLARHVAAQLPPGMASAMREAADASPADSGTAGERFGLTVFAGRIADRAGTDEDTALREAAAVLEVLDAALAPELLERMAGALPADIRELLPAGRASETTE
ncbi:hypothetical protein GCM10010503_63780 [Streptomyces lucensis JCM 4490]|uniref:DUF2267 domain-containing protein n=1 Tax=Streptomyces lucensis JCM 4490 TaxID=1306176 RepID=A0A918MWA7_9ACTN|nr:DUF2267 domain-containing protein [Streptomyces lucensis]GGW77153.1 hypothetical protein GCM10010503_63780 [Streptomyces lucensis JCM 4490]